MVKTADNINYLVKCHSVTSWNCPHTPSLNGTIFATCTDCKARGCQLLPKTYCQEMFSMPYRYHMNINNKHKINIVSRITMSMFTLFAVGLFHLVSMQWEVMQCVKFVKYRHRLERSMVVQNMYLISVHSPHHHRMDCSAASSS